MSKDTTQRTIRMSSRAWETLKRFCDEDRRNYGPQIEVLLEQEAERRETVLSGPAAKVSQ